MLVSLFLSAVLVGQTPAPSDPPAQDAAAGTDAPVPAPATTPEQAPSQTITAEAPAPEAGAEQAPDAAVPPIPLHTQAEVEARNKLVISVTAIVALVASGAVAVVALGLGVLGFGGAVLVAAHALGNNKPAAEAAVNASVFVGGSLLAMVAGLGAAAAGMVGGILRLKDSGMLDGMLGKKEEPAPAEAGAEAPAP